jgi:hypothetical protein
VKWINVVGGGTESGYLLKEEPDYILTFLLRLLFLVAPNSKKYQRIGLAQYILLSIMKDSSRREINLIN